MAGRSLEVVSAWFPPHTRLETHTHSRPLFGLMLGGTFRTSILGREVDYDAASAWTEPAEEKHANVAGTRGARVVIIQPTPDERDDISSLHRALFDEVVLCRSAELLADALSLEQECAAQDDLSPLVVEGIGLSLLARAARLFRRTRHHDGSPAWLVQAVEYLHAHRLEPVRLGDVARAVGVHPSRLAHEFRARLHESPGEYLRRLRVEWAAERLLDAEASVADVAASAGFFDQSHFARVFRRHYGVSPSAWRQSSVANTGPQSPPCPVR